MHSIAPTERQHLYLTGVLGLHVFPSCGSSEDLPFIHSRLIIVQPTKAQKIMDE